MFISISAFLQSIFNAFSKAFDYKKTTIEKQAETEIISEKRDYKKATNIAEKIIDIAIKYKEFMTWNDKRLLTRYINNFKKVN